MRACQGSKYGTAPKRVACQESGMGERQNRKEMGEKDGTELSYGGHGIAAVHTVSEVPFGYGHQPYGEGNLCAFA